MMTIDIETISGVPFTGELKSARPKMSAQTRKPSRKMIAAAAASSSRTSAGVERFDSVHEGSSRVRDARTRR